MGYRCVKLVLFCLLSLQSRSQVPDSLTYYLNFAGTGNINRTKEGTTYLFNNFLKGDYSGKYISVNTATSWIYGADAANLTNNDFSSVVDVDLFKSQRKLYYWGLAGYEKNYSLGITDRLQVGGGIGYKFLKRKTASIVVSDGLLYETTRLAEPDEVKGDHYQALRNSLRLKFRFAIKDFVVIDGVNFIQNSLSDKNDYIIKSTTTASVKLYKWLSLTTGVTYNRLNITSSENLFFSYGLMMEKYF